MNHAIQQLKAQRLTYPLGIIGVGNMGGAIAANLLEHHWPVHVCDIDAAKTQYLAEQGAFAQGLAGEDDTCVIKLTGYENSQ